MDGTANGIAAEFLNEVEGYMPELRGCLQALKKNRSNQEAAEELHRIVHTIKGAAAMVGFDDLSKTGALLEQVMDQVLDSGLVMDDELITLFGETAQRIDTFCTLRSVGEQGSGNLYEETLAAFEKKHRRPAPEEDEVPVEKAEPPQAVVDDDSIAGILDQLLSVVDGEEAEPEEEFLLNETWEDHEEKAAPKEEAIDPELLECFTEETAEHMENITLQLKRLAAEVESETALSDGLRESLHSLRRSVHTLKGAAAVIGIEPVAAWGREFEDFLDWLHDEVQALNPQAVAAIQDGSDLLAVLAEDPACSVTEEQQAATEQFKKIKAAGIAKQKAEPESVPPAEAAPLEEVDQAFASEVDDFFTEKTSGTSTASLFDELFADDTEEVEAASDALFQPEVAELAKAFPVEEEVVLPEPTAEDIFTVEQAQEQPADPLFEDLFASTAPPEDNDESLFQAADADSLFVAPLPVPEAAPPEEEVAEESEAIDPELLECFAEETTEHLENIDLQLKQLAAAASEEISLSQSLRENLHSLRRSVHTLKGAAAVIGIKPVAAWGHEFEDFLDWLHDESPSLGPQAVAAMQEGADILARLADNPVYSAAAEQQAAAARFQAIMTAPPRPVVEISLASTSDLPSESDVFFAEERVDEPPAPLFDELFPSAVAEPAEDIFAATPVESADSGTEAIDPELMQCFTEEAAEHLENIDQQLRLLAAQTANETPLSDTLREELHSLRRSVHTLKGAAAVIGIEPVAAWGHEFEDFLDWLHDESPVLHPEDVAAMQEGADLLVRITEHPAVPFAEKKAAITARFRSIMAGEKTAQPEPVAAIEIEPVCAPEHKAASIQEKPAEPLPTVPAQAAQAVQPPEQPSGGVRKINTLRVEINKIDQVVGLSGDMVINLSSFESSMSAMSGTLNELGMILQRLKSINHSLEAGYELATIPYLRGMGDTGSGGVTEDFDPLEMDRYSELNILIRSLSEAVSDLDSIMAQSALENIAWEKTVERQARVLKDIQNKMIGLRMTPFSVLSARMHRTVREAERSTGHPAQLILEGESIMMDTRVWDTMADALMHILRNSVAHGGSPERQLTVRIKAERRGGQFSLRISDDGKGLNYDAIRSKGMKLYPDERIGSLSDEKIAGLIFRHGFSSAGSISTIAGRGVGMDVVRDSVELLNGSIEIFSVRGKGLELFIRLPVAVAQLHAVLVRLAGQIYAVPMHDITSAARVRPEDIAANECEVDGRKLPLLNPAAIPGFQVGGAIGEAPPESELAVLAVQVGSRLAALLCEQIIGQRDIVFKDLGSHLSNVSCIAGVTIMGDGSLVPILQTDDLLKKWAELAAPSAEVEIAEEVHVEERPLQVLVVDDSISVRKVVSNFLLQQGWQPTIARNGIEALERIREEKPDLVLLDVEMPRMNGFEVLQTLQSQPEFQDIPVVMLTSRSADKYREKASQLGARGFMTKPFKEDEAIELIRSMTSRQMLAELHG
ncbi:Hpt domain-containing protein [Candidatus Electronema sp. PJ]|uniref:Hpt domain-containing protein n=1 Tax=Candidatus Electronema sp. PJ TaxID=3401572 RepID=UPI003AA85C97